MTTPPRPNDPVELEFSASSPSRTKTEWRHKRNYGLVGLFYATTVAAVLLATAATSSRSAYDSVASLSWAVAGTGLCGGILGAIVGLFHFRRIRGFIVGTLTGTFIGGTIGPALASEDFAAVSVASLGGSALLIVTGLILAGTRGPGRRTGK